MGSPKAPLWRRVDPSIQKRFICPFPRNHASITSKHKNLGQSLSSWKTELIEESGLTLVRQENHNHISHPMPRHCGSGKEHRREGKSQGQLAWIWNVIYYQIITSYLQAGITHLSLCHKERLPHAFLRAHCLFFPSPFAAGIV